MGRYRAIEFLKFMENKKCRLFLKAKILGYKRSTSNQYNHTSIIKPEGVESLEESAFFNGKKVAYVYKTLRNSRCIWGKVIRAHGTSGSMRVKFRSNLPPHAIGFTCRVMLYPSKI